MGITAGVGALIGGVVGGGASIASGVLGSNAAGNAASAQANAANNAAQLQAQTANNALNFNKQQYGNSLSIMAPWINTGQAANSRLGYLMGLSPNQGLPPGVVNPNSQQVQGSNTVPAGSVPGSNVNRNVIPGIGANQQLFGGGGISGTNLISPFTSPQSPEIAQAQGGQVGIQPGSVSSATADPGINNTNTGITNGGTFQLGGSTVNASPAQVPIQPGSPINASTNVGGPAQVPIQGQPGAATDPNANGGFGSLAQGWNQTFSSPTDVTEQNDPGYQFRLQQGQQALQNSAAARGGLLTGGTAKAINDYAQNSASNEYGNVYNRALQNYQTNYNTFSNDQSNLFNRLSALSGTGQTTAGQLSSAGLASSNTNANIGLTSAGQIGQNINNAGAAQGSGYVGGANAIGGALSGAANSVGGALSLYQLLNQQSNNGGQGV